MTESPSIVPPMLAKKSVRLARLREVVQRKVPGLTVIDGVRLTLDLLGRGVEVVEIFLVPELLAEVSSHPDLAEKASRGRLFQAPPVTLARLAPTRSFQGLLAVARVPRYTLRTDGVVIFLDRVQDPGNVGAAIRNAAAFGATGVACSPGCGDPFSPRAVRGSAGASLLLPVWTGAEFAPLAAAFARRAGEVAAAVGSAGTEAARWHPCLPLLLVLGNEGEGVAADIIALCPTRVTVPLVGGVESLNVASAAAVLLAGLAGVVPSPILDSESRVRRSP
jgi:TrmH family RNA methyltransferase